MPRPCTACTHPDAAAVDEVLVSGASYRAVALAFGLSAGIRSVLATRAVSPASGTAAAVTPAILHQIGRDLVLSGQSVMQFGVAGGPRLRRPAEYDLVGGPDPSTWRLHAALHRAEPR